MVRFLDCDETLEEELIWLPVRLCGKLEVTQLNQAQRKIPVVYLGRDDVTRTRDPYVPNVVRYQLRYISILMKKWQSSVGPPLSSYKKTLKGNYESLLM